MTVGNWNATAAAYDDVALSALGRALRSRVHDYLERLVSPGVTAIDIGCGTGIDAEWLVGRGADVVAIDASTEMVEATNARLGSSGRVVGDNLDQLDLRDLIDTEVDLVLANFGVINSIDNPIRLAKQLAAVVRPGGQAVVVTMTRHAPAEVAGHLVHGRIRQARRRWRKNGAQAEGPLDGTVHYYSARQLGEMFQPEFKRVHAESLGTLLPTFEQRRPMESRPGLLRTLARADRALGALGARLGIGDHQIVAFERIAS